MEQIRYKELVDSLSDWVWAVDVSGTYTYCSKNVYDFLGFHPDEVIGKTPFDFMSEEEAQRVGVIFGSYVSKCEDIVCLENTHIHKNSLEVIVETSAIPVLDEHGNLLGYQGFDKDITREKRIEKELKQKDKQMIQQSRLAQMGEMISMIAHQWRQPLAAISATSGNLQLKIELEAFDLESKEGVDEATKYFLNKLENIDSFVQNLTTTINDFRNFYKPNKKPVTLKLEEVILKSLNIIKASLIIENIEIVEEYNFKEKIELYDNEIIQVILNLLKNSQDNFKEKEIKNPKITIITNEKTISICDNGGGIPEDIIEKIFDPYFSTKDEKNGTALGLYMSKMIVEEHHNGILSAENRDDGVCFTIELRDI